jgi:hypothetical protein
MSGEKGYIDGFKAGLRDVAALCESIGGKEPSSPIEQAASFTAQAIRNAIIEKLALAEQMESTARQAARRRQ